MRSTFENETSSNLIKNDQNWYGQVPGWYNISEHFWIFTTVCPRTARKWQCRQKRKRKRRWRRNEKRKKKKKTPLRYKREVMYFHQLLPRNSQPNPFTNRSTYNVCGLNPVPLCRLPNDDSTPDPARATCSTGAELKGDGTPHRTLSSTWLKLNPQIFFIFLGISEKLNWK